MLEAMTHRHTLLSKIPSQLQTNFEPDDSDSTTADGYNKLASPNADANPEPVLTHKIRYQKSILALVVSDSSIYAGAQDGNLLVRIACVSAAALGH